MYCNWASAKLLLLETFIIYYLSFMDFSDSDIDPKEYKRLYAKQQKKLLSRLQQQQSQIDLQQPDTQGQNDQRSPSRIRDVPPPRYRQRQRSRDNPKQNICWHIYEDVGQIDYMDSLPEKLHKLPIFKKKDEIIQKIIQNQVVLITGDTGCGKSTQVPRLIYEYLNKIGQNDKIICVQPRRLAVTSLKFAVQSQLPPDQRVVGYQIGQKTQFSSRSRIVFMTNGIFLQRITHDTKFLNEYPFVVLDEVHERDIDTDFILTALKRIVRGFPKVRIVLMSATIDNELFRYYFASDHIDGFMKEDNFYKKIIELEEYQKAKNADDLSDEVYLHDDSDQQEHKKRQIYDTVALKFLDSRFPCPSININQPSTYHRQYFYLDTLDNFVEREYVKKWGSIHWSHRHPNTHKELFETACVILDQIRHNCRNKSDLSGEAVLVFLPGLNEIENFNEDVFAFLGGRERVFKEFQLIHVHSTIMTEMIEQKINTPNRKKIKLIISTNIAESSITVKGVKYVIDFCLTKQIRYDDKSRMENLELVFSSKASCKQRAGRTGRVCDGMIFRMVEKNFYDQQFQDYSEPEIKRSSLDKLILRIKLMHENDEQQLFADPPEVLGTCIQPPRLQSIQSAIDSLKFCGGLQQHGDKFIITQLGKLYVEIPIDIAYTKLLIVSILFGTFYDTLILVSMLSQNKNAIHRREIENNFFKYFDRISNYEYCDFLALVNLYKEEDQARRGMYDNKSSMHSQKGRLKFTIYTETKNTMQDIIKRLQRKWFNFGELTDYLEHRDGQDIRLLSKKCHHQKHPKPKYTDYYMRWKMTLAFGFVDKMIQIKPPVYDIKQEKRIRDMKKNGVKNERTVVLLNSSNITLPRNPTPQSIHKTITHWKNVFHKSINVHLHHLTLTNGLNYLHFDDDVQLNKLLYYKEMDSMVRKRGTGGCLLGRDEDERRGKEVEEKGSFLSVRQLIECLGDVNHMQEGMPYTLGKEQRVRIDQHSLNRVCSYIEGAPSHYLLTNSFMLQGKHDLVCRYTSSLNIHSFPLNSPPNTVLHTLANLLFYPFVKLKPNKHHTAYEYLALKKKYLLKIQYQLKETEIQRANAIREMVKQFFGFGKKVTKERCEEFWLRVKAFVVRKRKSMVNEINDEMWQGEFVKEVKMGKIMVPGVVKQAKVEGGQEKSQGNDNLVNNNINNNINNSNSILEQINQHTSSQNQKKQINQAQIPQSTYQTRNFMNPILLPEITANESYFLKAKQETASSYKNRMQFYIEWKKGKIKEVEKLSKYALDNDSYLCCGYVDPETGRKCDIHMCKLRRVGPMDEEFTCRDLFEPIMVNLRISQEPETEIDDYLISQNYQDQYVKYSCANNHEIGIINKGSTKVKIFVFKPYSVKYPDTQTTQSKQAEFQLLDSQHWSKEQSMAIKHKQSHPLSLKCFLCAFTLSSYQELKQHMQDQYHLQAVERFQKGIEIAQKELKEGEKEEVEEEIQYDEKSEQKVEEKKKDTADEPIEIEY